MQPLQQVSQNKAAPLASSGCGSAVTTISVNLPNNTPGGGSSAGNSARTTSVSSSNGSSSNVSNNVINNNNSTHQIQNGGAKLSTGGQIQQNSQQIVPPLQPISKHETT